MKNYTEFKSAQDILSDINPDYLSGTEIHGFNWRLQGYDPREFKGDYRAYQLADKAIESGKIFFVENFKCKCGDYRFEYGGGWACNNCNNCISAPDWWYIKVQQDGDMFICIGNGFVNLQESSNYAFGKTKQEAKENYRALFIK